MSRPSTPAYAIRRAPITAGSQAASSGVPGRAGTPLSSKQVISTEEWERLAPLTDEDLQIIAKVKEQFTQRPVPEHLVKAETSVQGAAASTSAAAAPSSPPRHKGVTDLLSTPRASSRPSSAPPSPAPAPDRQGPSDALHPTSLATPQEFHDHFTALTLSTEHEQDSLYRDHLAEIVALREKCDGLIDLLKEGEAEVHEMLICLAHVEERSESLRGACEDLLEEQTHLLTHTSQLAHRLTFFTFLEKAQKMLNNPGNDLVLSEDFLPMVKRLDECLGYLGEHDAELFLIRYQQCMTRSMTLIKLYFVNTIKAMGQDISKRLTDRALSETAIQALVYTKFVTLSSSIRPLLAELEHRVKETPNELSSLLSECHAAWVAARQMLIGSRVGEEVGRMEPSRSDLVDLTRAGCSFLKQTCLDEFNLFKYFFLSGESQLYGFLEGLCDYLYDHLRPRILHEPSLETLCAVCTVLQALMVQDVAPDNGDDDDHAIYSPESTPIFSPASQTVEPLDYFSSRPNGHQRGNSIRQSSVSSPTGLGYNGSIMTKSTRKRRSRTPLSRLHTEVLLKMVLQDAQTRLVFRAQALLQADVQYFAPKEGDLDYPAKLGEGSRAAHSIRRTMAISLDPEDDDEPAILSLPPAETQENWYPTLRVTLWVLSCLYTYVDSSVFDDLAQEALSTCRYSLSAASDLMGAKKEKSMDAKLFLVRHLLILKEMTAGLNLGKRDRARDWSGITDFLRSLLENASAMIGYSRPVARGGDNADAKTDIDRELKKACEDLISLLTAQTTTPLRQFIDQCSAYLAKPHPHPSGSTGTADPANCHHSDLSTQAFATRDKVKEVHDAFKDRARGDLEAWCAELMRYLQDPDTVRVLVQPAQNSIVDAYRHFHDLIRAEYDFATAASILTPSAVHSLLSSVGVGVGVERQTGEPR